jgi:hypothetical protein
MPPTRTIGGHEAREDCNAHLMSHAPTLHMSSASVSLVVHTHRATPLLRLFGSFSSSGGGRAIRHGSSRNQYNVSNAPWREIVSSARGCQRPMAGVGTGDSLVIVDQGDKSLNEWQRERLSCTTCMLWRSIYRALKRLLEQSDVTEVWRSVLAAIGPEWRRPPDRKNVPYPLPQHRHAKLAAIATTGGMTFLHDRATLPSS